MRLLACLLFALAAGPAFAADAPVLRSKQSGAWSAADTWDGGRVPKGGDHVVIRTGHKVDYDAASAEVVRVVQVAGTLEFARDRDTKLEAGLVLVTASEKPTEAGFDCHSPVAAPAAGKPRPELLVGTADRPIPAKFTALVRLHHLPGMDAESCPAVVCCGGRMEFHGAPLSRTWVKLKRTAEAGATSVALAEPVEGWKAGDAVVLTGTRRVGGGSGRGEGPFADAAQTELRKLVSVGGRGPGPDPGQALVIKLDAPLKSEHFAEGDYRGEVANLSRNVVVESAAPEGVRGHTMYHRHSSGSIGYAEFRHLGKRDTIGRYPLHFHLCGDTLRGTSVIGASIWDSHNRFVSVHGTNYLVVRDCVGYKGVGHGYFLEDGTEVFNALDRNLAALVLAGKPHKGSVVPFDENRGAGFWWANSFNAFTRNVAADCEEYGYRFEARKTADFDPVRPVQQPDGSLKPQDIRTTPFLRFEGNEAHAMRFFGLNLRGVTRSNQLNPAGFHEMNDALRRDAAGAHPDYRRPFVVKNFRVWEANWSFHAGTSGVFVDGLDVYRSEYGLWRSVMDRHTYRNLSFKEISNKELHMPFSIGTPETGDEASPDYFRGIAGFQDTDPPVTVITQVLRDGTGLRVRGTTSDCSALKRVTVNGRRAALLPGGSGEWEVTLDAATAEVSAHAEDAAGNVEPRPHVVAVGK